jgi:hypothetical protein
VQAVALVIASSIGSEAEAKTAFALSTRASPFTGTSAVKFALLSVTVMNSFEACKPSAQLLVIETPTLLPLPVTVAAPQLEYAGVARETPAPSNGYTEP